MYDIYFGTVMLGSCCPWLSLNGMLTNVCSPSVPLARTVTVSCFIISQLLLGTRSESQLSSPLKRYQNRNATMLPHCAHTGHARPIQAPFGNYRSNKSKRQWQWQRQMQLGVYILLSGRKIYVCQIIISGVLSLRAQWGREEPFLT